MVMDFVGTQQETLVDSAGLEVEVRIADFVHLGLVQQPNDASVILLGFFGLLGFGLIFRAEAVSFTEGYGGYIVTEILWNYDFWIFGVSILRNSLRWLDKND